MTHAFWSGGGAGGVEGEDALEFQFWDATTASKAAKADARAALESQTTTKSARQRGQMEAAIDVLHGQLEHKHKQGEISRNRPSCADLLLGAHRRPRCSVVASDRLRSDRTIVCAMMALFSDGARGKAGRGSGGGHAAVVECAVHGQVRERGAAFPCASASAAILQKADAFACGAAV